MKLVRYGKAGAEKPGLIDSDGTIRDLSAHVTDFAGDALLPANIKKLAALDPKSLPAVAAGTRLGSCVPKPGNFIAVGLNFADHAAETNNPLSAWREPTRKLERPLTTFRRWEQPWHIPIVKR